MQKNRPDDSDSITAYRILVADDEAGTRKAVTRALELSGYSVWGAANGKEVFSILDNEPIDLLLLDLRMPEMDGLQVMQQIIRDRSDLIVIVLTAHATLESAITAVKAGASDYLTKPQSIDSIKKAIQEALERKTTEKRRQRLLQIASQTIEALQDGEQNSAEVRPPKNQKDDPDPVFCLQHEQRLLQVRCKNEECSIELTADQYAIIALLAAHPGKVFAAEMIVRLALGYMDLDAFESLSIVRTHIRRLRQRLNICSRCSDLIKTVRGSGYAVTRGVKSCP